MKPASNLRVAANTPQGMPTGNERESSAAFVAAASVWLGETTIRHTRPRNGKLTLTGGTPAIPAGAPDGGTYRGTSSTSETSLMVRYVSVFSAVPSAAVMDAVAEKLPDSTRVGVSPFRKMGAKMRNPSSVWGAPKGRSVQHDPPPPPQPATGTATSSTRRRRSRSTLAQHTHATPTAS